MKFEKIFLEEGNRKKLFYWTWADLPFFPYAWLDKKDLASLPKPFYLPEIHPDCLVGFETKDLEEFTNIIKLPESFEKLIQEHIDNDLRKDLKRVEKKNIEAGIKLVYNEKDSLEKSKHWFVELWKENNKDLKRRIEIWKKHCYTISAYLKDKLIAVHISMKGENISEREKDTIYYVGCWWDRNYKSLSIPTYLLMKDIENSIKNGFKFYDLEVGDQSYKKKWNVIEKPTKYYAILTKQLAEALDVEKFVEMK